MDWNTFYSKVKAGAEKVGRQVSDTADLASLQIKLSGAEKRLEDAYTALGKASFKHFMGKENTADAVAEAIEGVKTAKREMAALKKKIKAKKDAAAKEKEEREAAKAEKKAQKEAAKAAEEAAETVEAEETFEADAEEVVEVAEEAEKTE